MLSIAGAALVIYMYTFGSEKRATPLRQLIILLAITDLFAALSYSIDGPASSDIVCKIQSSCTMYFNMASFICTDCIASVLFQATVETEHISLSDTFDQTYMHMLTAIILPIPLVALVGIFDKWGSSVNYGGWNECWLSEATINSDTFLLWSLIGSKAVEWCSLVYVFVMYSRTVLNISKLNLTSNHHVVAGVSTPQYASFTQESPSALVDHYKQTTSMNVNIKPSDDNNDTDQDPSVDTSGMQLRMLFIPIAFLLVRLPSIIRGFCYYANPGNHAQSPPDDILSVLQAALTPAQGFANCICFAIMKSDLCKLRCISFWGCGCFPSKHEYDAMES
jgi:hypothetical protein